MAFHRAVSGCRDHHVTLVQSSDEQIFGLRVYANNSPLSAQYRNFANYSPYLSGGENARIFFRNGYTHAAGVLTVTLLTNMPACSGVVLPAELSLEWAVTVTAATPWETLAHDDDEADSVFDAATLNAAPASGIDTGLVFQRGAVISGAGCYTITRVSVSDSSKEIFGLVTYTGNNRGSSAPADTRDISPYVTNPQSARIFFRSGYTHRAATLTVELRRNWTVLRGAG